MTELYTTTTWQTSEQHAFWGEIAPADHVLQIYENDDAFLDLLEGYVSGGLKALECVIVIATPAHLTALDNRLKAQGFNIEALCADDQLIRLDAAHTLRQFMPGNWPDEKLFHETISGIVRRAHARNRHIRAFGEMVALLWAQGHNGATVQLEKLWNIFCASEGISLFCAYPKSGFTKDITESMEHICSCHSKLVSNAPASITEVRYKTLQNLAG